MNNMTSEERNTCKNIIHTHAVAAAAGNLIPVPGAGFAADTITMTTMAARTMMITATRSRSSEARLFFPH